MKFEKGMRVAVYREGKRLKGVIESFINSYQFFVRCDDNWAIIAHTKQCRLLKKKPRRRVWVEFDYNTNEPRAVAESYEKLETSWEKYRQDVGGRYIREFIEVRKK